MKKENKNLLSKKVYRRDAQNYRQSKINPRVPKRFQGITILTRATLIFLLVLFFSGYHPVLTYPPLKASVALADEINKQNDQILTASIPQLNLPHTGYISTHFSAWHPGIDIATGLGMPIHPITAGVVESVTYGFWGYGNHVIVAHPEGFKSLYAHMGKIYVKKDQIITSSDSLGEVGLSGYTTGPHIHLEISYKGKNIDPLTILPPLPDMPVSSSAQRGEPQPQYTAKK